MPCRDWEGETEADRRESQTRQEYSKKIESLQEKIDKLTRMLCWLSKTWERVPYLNNDDRLDGQKAREEWEKWWPDHQNKDNVRKQEKQRIEDEKKAKEEDDKKLQEEASEASNKLSASELAALIQYVQKRHGAYTEEVVSTVP